MRSVKNHGSIARLMRIGTCALAAAALAVAGQANRVEAQVVYNNFGAGDSYNTATGWTVSTTPIDQKVAQQFTPSGTGVLTSIEVAMGLVQGVNHFDLALLTDSSNTPGSVIESWSVDNAMGTFGSNNVPIFLASALNPLISVGTPYWIAIGTSTQTWSAWNWNDQGATGLLASGSNGGSFNPPANNTLGAMRVTVRPSAVPEPSSMALLFGGGAGCMFMIRRRRKS